MRRIDDSVYELEVSDIRELFSKREDDSHKGMFGKAGIYGGSLEYSGALKLAYLSLASLRSGCGISRILTKREVLPLLGPNILEQTICVLPDYDDSLFYDKLLSSISDLDSLAFGMGLGRDDKLEDVLSFIICHYQGNLIIDADGLNTLSRMDLDILRKKTCNILLTPHLKEFSRLTSKDIEEISLNKIDLVSSFARKYDVCVLLKGHTTVISDGRCSYLITTGCSGMATAGSGDVLSGILAGLFSYLDFRLLSIAAGVFLHGIAGCIVEEEESDISMISGDILSHVGDAVKVIRGVDI